VTMLVAFFRQDEMAERYQGESGGIASECPGDGCGGVCGKCLL
jgi:hypothetical protein